MKTGAAIALGNFDGLHAGHRAVIEDARRMAKQIGAPLGVATFEPAPRRFFQPDAPPFRLMTPLRRQIALDAIGVDELHPLRFDAVMAAMTDREFCEQVVMGEVGARAVSVGFDFRFGKGRMGDAESLQRIGAELGFEVSIVAEVTDAGAKVSSSRIREAIERGDMDAAASGLGGCWIVDAIVEQGEKGFFIRNRNKNRAADVLDGLAEADVGAEGASVIDAFDALLADLAFDEPFDLLGNIFLADEFDDQVQILLL